MRGFALLLCLPLLAGCAKGDWDYLTSFGGSADQSAAAAPPVREAAAQAPPAPAPAGAQPAAPAARRNTFCEAVARQDALGNGFDTATQQRVAQRSYQQCIGIFGDMADK